MVGYTDEEVQNAQTEHIVEDDSSANPTGSKRANSLLCAVVDTEPRAWIDWPLDVCEVEPDTTVTVISHPRCTLRPGGRACLPSAGRVSAGGGIGGRSAHVGFYGPALLWA